MTSFEDPGDVGVSEYVLGSSPDDERIALVDYARGGRTWTYPVLKRAVQGLAGQLRSAGLADGDRVAILVENSAEFVIAYHGVLAAGCVALPLDPRDPPLRWASEIARCGATALVAEAAVGTPDFAGTKSPIPAERTIFVGEPATAGSVQWTTAIAAAPHSRPATGGERVAVLMSSSGTLGTPKRIPVTHHNLVANLAQIAAVHRIHEHEAVLPISPLRHIYGMQMAMNPVLRAGGTLIIGASPFSVPDFLRYVRTHEVAVVYAVPTVIAELATVPRESRLPRLRLIVSGGAPLPHPVAQRCADALGAPVVQGFGMTEAGCLCISPDDRTPPSGSVGVVVPGAEVRFVDPATGRDAEPGYPGELWVRGPQVVMSDPDSPVVHTDDGWLRTGDLATRDAGGFVRLTGRIKSMIKYKGHQVSPTELEEVLTTHPAVVDAYVSGVPHPVAGEVPKAYVVLNDTVPLAEITAHVGAMVAPHKRLRLIERVRKIPRSATGKPARPPRLRVLLTGGSHGLGKACAAHLAATGASVIVTGRDEHALTETVKAIRDGGGTAEFVVADLTDAEAVARAAAQATDTFGGVDVLVNNAGTPGPLGPLWTIDEHDWWRTLEVNVRGSWLFTREVVPGMITRGSGRIITIVSRAGLHRWPFACAYAVSKSALIALTANLDGELRDTGVIAVAFDPGKLEIGITKAHFDRGHTENPWENRIHDWLRAARDTGDFTPVDTAVQALTMIAAGAADHIAGKYVATEDLALD